MSLQGEVLRAQTYLITLEPKTPKLHLKPGRLLIGKLQMERIRLGGCWLTDLGQLCLKSQESLQ